MVKYFTETFFPLTWKNMLHFLFLWLLIGFTVGSGLLLGPVQEITGALRDAGWADTWESLVINTIIILYVIATFFAALVFTRISIQTRYRLHAWGILGMWSCLMLGSLYLWLSPSLVTPNQQTTISSNPRFTFGSYPSPEDIQRLEEEGYTGVISLLHPAVVPFEPELIRREKNAIANSGLDFIHLPMLPWISENVASRDSLKTIAQTGTGRYYVHCYLGRDRIGMVRSIIESMQDMPETNTDSLFRTEASNIPLTLERGSVTHLENRVFFSPYPTDAEFIKYFFGKSFKIVSLLNPENTNDVQWIEKEQKLLAGYGIPFSNFPVSLEGYDPANVLDIARKVKSLEPPVLVHGFLSPSFRSQSFIQAYRSDLPPIPPSFFTDSLTNGVPKVIAPNLAVGPRPSGPEFGSVLQRKGIREFIYLGQPADSAATKDELITRNSNLSWSYFNPNEETIEKLVDKLAVGGPWYVYGPGLDSLKETLITALGPTIPDSMTYTPEQPTTDAYLSDFTTALIPSVKLSILLSPALLVYIFMAAMFAGYLYDIKGIATPYTRKIFHVLIFLMAGLLQMLIDVSAVVLFGILTSLAVLYAIYRGEGFPFYESMARETDHPKRTLFIIIPLITTALGGLTANILFGSIAYIGYLVTGLGDAVGEPVGKRWGANTYKVPSLAGVPAKRSIEGSLAVFFTSIFVSFLALWLGGINLTISLGVAFACGIAAACVEAISNHGLDNFTIQVAATGMAYLLL